MVNDISVLNEWWLVSMPIPMEPQRQAIGNLIDLKSHCAKGESELMSGWLKMEKGNGVSGEGACRE